MPKSKTVAVDFDGVLVEGGVWEGPYVIPPMREHADRFLARLNGYYRVVIFSNRAPAVVMDWLFRHDLMQYVDDVTQFKPMAFAYIDDKAIAFEGDFDVALAQALAFMPYWAREKGASEDAEPNAGAQGVAGAPA